MVEDSLNNNELVLKLVEKIEAHAQNTESSPAEERVEEVENHLESLENRNQILRERNQNLTERVDDFEDNILGELRGINRDREKVESFEERLNELDDRVEELHDTIGYLAKALEAQELGQTGEDQDAGEDDYVCDKCGESFDNGKALGGHKGAHGKWDNREEDTEESEQEESDVDMTDVSDDPNALGHTAGDTEDDSKPFFKNIEPTEVGFKVRANAVAEYLKERQQDEGKYYGETIETIVENVFGTNVLGVDDPNYKNVYSVIDDDKRIEKHKKTGERNQMEWRYNPRLKT